jgi:predicted TIM-barrel fold metal-dependent hydrolase
MYEYDNLRFAAWLATRITAAPIVLLHSGGLRALEAWLLAASCPNVWLETSFSVPTYEGTRVEQDLYTAYHKLGGERVLYASDHPYITMQDSLAIFRRFVKNHKFTSTERDQMLCGSADHLLNVVA